MATATGCSSRVAKIDRLARTYACESAIVQGAAFRHRVYRRGSSVATDVLNVYLEGDGSPYLSRYAIRADPTPAQPVMLHLMALDPGRAVYIGRPCYFGLHSDDTCDPRAWTLDRFGPRIVESLATVIRAEADRAAAKQVRLFGHSGGGALAVLLARELGTPAVAGVVTLAGNLDHTAWTQHHGYAPLTGSLNPIDGGRLSTGIRQFHLYGARDTNIPAAMMKKAAEEHLGGRWEVAPRASHTCCWEDIWPAVLDGQNLR